MADLLDVVKGAATVALIAFAVRWLSTAKGADRPAIHDDVTVYGIKWPLRLVAYSGAALCLVLAFINFRANLAGGRWLVNIVFAALAFGAFGSERE